MIFCCWHTSLLSHDLLSPEAIIRFGATKFSVSEPSESGQISVVRIPVQRTGDTSKVSVVRVHTKDGSASSGEDYHPISEGGFKHNIIAWFSKTAHWGISQNLPRTCLVHILSHNHFFFFIYCSKKNKLILGPFIINIFIWLFLVFYIVFFIYIILIL